MAHAKYYNSEMYIYVLIQLLSIYCVNCNAKNSEYCMWNRSTSEGLNHTI